MSEASRPESEDKLLFGGVFVASLLGAGLFIGFILFQEYRFSRYGTMTEGVVEHKHYTYGRRRYKRRYSLEYSYAGPDGMPQRAEEYVIAPVFDSLEPGDRVTVRYLLTDPGVSQIWDGGNTRRAVGTAVFGLILLAGMARMWVYSRSERRVTYVEPLR